MKKKPNRPNLPDSDITTVRAAVRQFAPEGVSPQSDTAIDKAIEEIVSLATIPTKIGPIAKRATELLKNLGTAASECSKSLRILDTHMKNIILFAEDIEDDELHLSFEMLACYTDIDGIEEDEIRTESTLVNYLIDRIQRLSQKTNNHVTRINEKYDSHKSIFRFYKMSPAQIIVFNCYIMIYKYFGMDGIKLITSTKPSQKFYKLSKFYLLVLSVHNLAFQDNYNPIDDVDIFIHWIKQLETKDETKIRALCAL